MLVADDDITAAVTLQTTTMGLSGGGTGSGRRPIAASGSATVYLIDVATYAVSPLPWVRFLPRLWCRPGAGHRWDSAR